MGWKIEIGNADFEQLSRHLSGDVEQVAFLFTEPYANDHRLRVRALQLIPAEGFRHQGSYHVELADEIRPELIKRAWDENACLIEAHSHLDGPAGFSSSDLAGFEEWVPHLRWRLRGRPYAALVFAPDDFDALLWDSDGDPVSIEGLQIGGGATLVPTNYTPRPTRIEKGKKPEEERKDKKSWWRTLLGR